MAALDAATEALEAVIVAAQREGLTGKFRDFFADRGNTDSIRASVGQLDALTEDEIPRVLSKALANRLATIDEVGAPLIAALGPETAVKLFVDVLPQLMPRFHNLQMNSFLTAELAENAVPPAGSSRTGK